MTEYLIDRAARYQPCPKCSHHTITAIVGGVTIRADPEPVDINGEIAALLTGKSTWDVHSYGLPRRMHLEDRDIDRIRAVRKYPVIASHQCTPQAIRAARQPETDIIIPYARNEESSVPMF